MCYVKNSYCRGVCIIVTEHQCPLISNFPWSAIVFSESEQFVPAWKETVFSNVCSSPRVQLADKFKIGYTTIIERQPFRMITFSMSSNSFGHGLIGSKTLKSWNPVKSGWLGEKLCWLRKKLSKKENCSYSTVWTNCFCMWLLPPFTSQTFSFEWMHRGNKSKQINAYVLRNLDF